MIVDKITKGYETHSAFPSSNWYGETKSDVYIVYETTDKALAEKIQANAPYFDFVLDSDGKLVDIIPTTRPSAPPPEPTLKELNAQLIAQAEAIAALFEQIGGVA